MIGSKDFEENKVVFMNKNFDAFQIKSKNIFKIKKVKKKGNLKIQKRVF
jgi:hypothetical protein